MISNSGAVVFVYVGNSIILNIRAEAKHKDKFPALLIGNTIATLIVYMVYAAMAAYVYRSTTPSVFLEAL